MACMDPDKSWSDLVSAYVVIDEDMINLNGYDGSWC